jgi:hypothetical protein
MTDLAMLTFKEAAREMGVSETKLRQIVDTPGGPKSIPWGNERRIPRWHLREWQAEKLGFNDSTITKLLTE